jgi:membrane-associated phospholipid phosphatase
VNRPTRPGPDTPGAESGVPEAIPLWPYAVAFGVLLAAGIAFGLMAREARQELPDGPDQHLARWVAEHRDDWPLLTRLMLAATRLGDAPFAVGLSLAGAAMLVALPRHAPLWSRIREAAFWLAVLASSWVMNRFLKAFFARERPPSIGHLIAIDDQSFSFPSGHAAFAGCFFGLAATLALRHVGRRPVFLRALVLVVCLGLALAVGASRVWLAVHYVSDVIGGLALGLAWAVASVTIHYGWRHWIWWRRRRLSAA